MTFPELAQAVHRDCEAINPSASSAVECSSRSYGHRQDLAKRDMQFCIWHDDKLKQGLGSAVYHGATPDEVYDKFLAAVMQPATPTYSEVLELCDMPAAVGLMP
jgi:hypothetical protein